MSENSTIDKRKVVPWFSMLEWQEVYEQIYSGDVEAQQKGYEKMLVWKARCVTLPAGIECTLSLIHVFLQEQQIWPQIVDGLQPPYKEYDLRLMYSTAIMRFLNHVSLVAQDQFETLYKMAKKVHIPDWVVNIRHDLAHGHNLPSLNVLRSATHFALDWIHEHYWKGELNLATDYVATESPVRDDEVKKYFQEYIELGQGLKLYLLNGFVNVQDIPDTDFLSRLRHIIVRLRTKRRIKSYNSLAKNRAGTQNYLKQRGVKGVLNQLLTHLEIFLARNKKILLKDELLVTTLLEGETFIPNEDLFRTLAKENNAEGGILPSKLRAIWQNIMKLLPGADIFPILVEKLIQLMNQKNETNHRRKIAAKWLKEICLSLIKANWVHRTLKQVQNDKLRNMTMEVNNKNERRDTRNSISKIVQRKIIEEVERIRPEVKGVLALNAVDLPNSMELLKLILLSPNKWTLTFLPSFLDLVEPEVPSTVKLNIIKLVQTYTCTAIGHKHRQVEHPEVNIYTLDMLMKSLEKPVDSEMEVDNEPAVLPIGCDNNQEDQPDHGDTVNVEQQSLRWTRSETCHEWENCPLGILPWQKTENIANISFVCNSVWKTAVPTNNTSVCKWLPSQVHATVDWDNIQPVRKRLKKLKKRPNVKKAGKLTMKR